VSRPIVLAVAACLTGAFAATRAEAQTSAGDPAIAMSMDEAWAELSEEERALAAGDCETMCKALHSMARAAQRICALAEGGNDADRQRCVDAKARVEEATKRVLAACPACNPSPPYAPATVPPPPPPVGTVDKGAASTDEAETTALSGLMEVRAERRMTPRFTLAIAPAALFLPPTIARLSVETRIVDHLSLAVSGGIGRLATVGGDGHATTFTFGGQLRGYLFGAFSGLYVAADLRYARASLEDGERLSTRLVLPGMTIGPAVGFKVIAFGGFTLDTSFGLGVVAVDRRREGQPSTRVEPTWDLGLGYSF
jgi:hypothetical protein